MSNNTTRPIVPRVNGDSSVGVPDKHWGESYIDEGHFDSVKLKGGDVGAYLAESTGYGIVSGCTPSISGLTVTVGAGVVHLADGTRKEISATNITLGAADRTNPRIDLVYIDSTGAVAKITGTASASPVVPTLPTGGISVCNVSVAANASAGTVTDKRDFLYAPRTYSTVADMVNDSSLIENNVVTTLGYYYIDDGCGEKYQIIAGAHTADGDKIIALNNGLYAKRITQSDLPDIFLGGFFTSDSDTNVQLYATVDGAHFNSLATLDIESRDVSIRYYKNTFYMVQSAAAPASFIIYKSHDLKNWTSQTHTVIARNNKQLWAPDLFIDNDGSAYVYFAFQWGTEQVGTADHAYTSLDMYVSRCSNIENAEFETAVSMNLPTFNNDVTVVRGNNIDGHVFRIADDYYCIVKSDHQLSLQNGGGYLGLNLHLLKSANAMTNWTEVTTFPLQWIRGIEGASVVVKNDIVYIYADAYWDISIPRVNDVYYGGEWVWSVDVTKLEQGPYKLQPICANKDTRHGCVISIDSNYAKRVLESLSISFINADTDKKRNVIHLASIAGRVDNHIRYIRNFAPVQDTIYIVGDNLYHIIDGVKNVNKATDFYFRNAGNNANRVWMKNLEGDNQEIWIGNNRDINGQLLHFKLIGNEVMYVGSLNQLYKHFTYNETNGAFLLATFTFNTNCNIHTRVRVYSDSFPYHPDFWDQVFDVSIYRIGSTVDAKWTRISGNGYLDTKFIKTGEYQYQLWCKTTTEFPAIEFQSCQVYNTLPNPFKILSFESQKLADYPAGTEIALS